MNDNFFYIPNVSGNKIYDQQNITAALAAAGINIIGVTRGQVYDAYDEEGAQYKDRFIVQYEWQWRSKGNYIWSKSVFMGDYLYECMYHIYLLVRAMRDQLEDPSVRGNYRYLEEE